MAMVSADSSILQVSSQTKTAGYSHHQTKGVKASDGVSLVNYF